MDLPYTLSELRRGIRDPSKVRRELVSWGNQLRYAESNIRKEFHQRDNNSKYGLVLNWGLHKRDHWTAAWYPFFVKRFVERFDAQIVTSQRSYDRKSDNLEYLFAFGSRNKKGPTLKYDTDLDQTVLLFVSDPHNRSEFLEHYIKDNEIDRVVSPYYYPVLHHLPGLEEERLEHFPWPVPEKFVVDPTDIEYRDDDVLRVSGAGGSEAYELRDWVREQPMVDGYQNSGTQNKVMSNEEYYEWLRNFDCQVAAGSLKDNWQYVVPKYYEIAAGGSLLFAQYCRDLERVGFDESNSVIFHSRDDFTQKAKAYLDDPDSYLDRRRRGAELVAERHTISDRLDQIETLFHSRV
ncbi:glycosyltransferase [Halorubrum sp. CSM-61]|uniref:glycosyltransferase n=1 Tax=Halorubrum sp. CSM-61 TaxID=2485838 RepID=UPI000F4C22AC|nr:glycosyltransferase [Halorubrum sp. CSM-61]